MEPAREAHSTHATRACDASVRRIASAPLRNDANTFVAPRSDACVGFAPSCARWKCEIDARDGDATKARSPGMAAVRAVDGALKSERVMDRRDIFSSTVRRVATDDRAGRSRGDASRDAR